MLLLNPSNSLSDIYIEMAFLNFSTQKVGEWTIYPWIHSNSNSLSDSDQLRPVSIPDIHPARYVLSYILLIFGPFSRYINYVIAVIYYQHHFPLCSG